ncbi:MAG: hypothetical protein JNK25_01575 [Phycisphaerae bacterium]|nr:hypothetical protein [Phycisphaerae bacterium]
MRRILEIIAIGEALTGLALVVSPTLVTGFLLGATVEGTGIIACRVAGFALIGLGLACWPRATNKPSQLGMLVYSLVVTIYLSLLGIGGDAKGILLWPAVAVHATITLLLARMWFDAKKPN